MSLGIGIIGTGVMGRGHLETIVLRTTHAHVAAVCDADPARAADAASRAGTSRQFSDPLELIGCSEVDAVVVASPDDTHFHCVEACIQALKPVLCEKPLAATSAECGALVAMEAKAGRQLIQVGFMRRFDPHYVEIKAAYGSGAIGPAQIVRCVHRNAKAPDFFQPGMAISNAMVHEFDICRWLLGAEIERIRIDYIPPMEGSAAPDPLLATLRTSAGQLISIEVFMNAGYGYDIRTELVGSSGVLTMGAPPFGNLMSIGGGGLKPPADFIARFADAYGLQMRAWVNGISSGCRTGASARDGLMATLVAEAGVESFRSGEWKEIRNAPLDALPLQASADAP